MDFPVFEAPWLGGRWLIGVVAILHVLINHGAAVGGSLLVVLLERRGHLSGDPRWDHFAHRLASVFFWLTTSLGALTGVGIWFTVMVVQPTAIGNLLRIFFWGWFVEWIVFVLEVLLVVTYFKTWKTMDKAKHIRLGFAYAAFSFVTMCIIVGILGAMLTPDRWLAERGFWQGFLNPSYLPQLLTRSGMALGMAGALGLVLSRWLAPKDLVGQAQAFSARFVLASVPCLAIGSIWYLQVLPAEIHKLVPTALLTTKFASYLELSAWVNGALGLVLLQYAVWATLQKVPLPRAMAWLPLVVIVAQIGQFERVREFVRKPYVIHGYLYSNGIRVDQVARMNREGYLAHARYAKVREVTPQNRLLAGQELYRHQCATCHTVGGLNDIVAKFPGAKPEGILPFLGALNDVQPFMPPFAGTPAEREALAAYLASLQPQAEAVASPALQGATP